MKIFKKFLVLFVVMMLIPIFVNADMGLPMVTSYKMRVSNTKGIKGTYTTWVNNKEKTVTVTIPYDTVLETNYDYIEKGVLYADVEYKDENVKIKVSDAELMQDTYTPTKENKINSPVKKYVIREGAYLYKGPSVSYGKVEGNLMLPVGTTFTVHYRDEVWSYVTYKGVSGWVYTYEFGPEMSPYKWETLIVNVVDGSEYIVNKIELKDLKGNKIGTVPAGVEANIKYYYGRNNYFIEYGTLSGWYVNNGYNIAYIQDGSIYTINKTKIYSNTDGKKSIGTIPKNVEVNYKYAIYEKGINLFYVEYNGISGWVENEFYDDTKQTFIESINGIGEVDKDFKVYDGIRGKATKNIIDQYSNVEVIFHYSYYLNEDEYENWYYVKSGNIKGWIKGELEYEIEDDEVEDLIIDPVTEPEPVIEPVEEPVIQEEPVTESPVYTENKDVKSLSFNEIATYCVCGAVVISIIAIIIVGIVNDKKKKAVVVKPQEETNNEEVKEEKKEDENKEE